MNLCDFHNKACICTQHDENNLSFTFVFLRFFGCETSKLQVKWTYSNHKRNLVNAPHAQMFRVLHHPLEFFYYDKQFCQI